MAFALFGASAPTGAISGAVAGIALNLIWWPYSFYVLAIVLCILTVGTGIETSFLIYPPAIPPAVPAVPPAPAGEHVHN